ncbi:MAG: hypothetical protein SPC23_05910 [Lachnospiraceae bacterium]|nr:hypothetical protein [Lachnospiraceae bacterium]
MAFTDKTEKGFETLIVNWLVEQNGYEQGTNCYASNIMSISSSGCLSMGCSL